MPVRQPRAPVPVDSIEPRRLHRTAAGHCGESTDQTFPTMPGQPDSRRRTRRPGHRRPLRYPPPQRPRPPRPDRACVPDGPAGAERPVRESPRSTAAEDVPAGTWPPAQGRPGPGESCLHPGQRLLDAAAVPAAARRPLDPGPRRAAHRGLRGEGPAEPGGAYQTREPKTRPRTPERQNTERWSAGPGSTCGPRRGRGNKVIRAQSRVTRRRSVGRPRSHVARTARGPPPNRPAPGIGWRTSARGTAARCSRVRTGRGVPRASYDHRRSARTGLACVAAAGRCDADVRACPVPG